MKSMVRNIAFQVQKFILWGGYLSGRCFTLDDEKETWVVGVDEISALLKDISAALPSAVSVNLSSSPFYSYRYNFNLRGPGRIKQLQRILMGPFLLGVLSARYKYFLYLGPSGFLFKECDGRNYEFSFLKARNKRIVCIFTGSEIRSFKLFDDFSTANEMDVITTYQRYVNIGIASVEKEEFRKKLAETADLYADVIVNPPFDQMSYIERVTYPFMYFYPNENFVRNEQKFEDLRRVKILHAPSSPIIKGTPLVRAAIKKLKTEGYLFDYVELVNVPHSVVLSELRSSHIVLNQFYAFIPGVFGIEAMASHCAVLTSADERFEHTLQEGANQAWCVTRYWEVYDNLKNFLDNKKNIKDQADRGFAWAYKNCSYSASRANLLSIVRQSR